MQLRTALERQLTFGHAHFKRKEPALCIVAAPVTDERAVSPDHAVAGNDD